jgi:hypothetical protein
MGFRELVTSLGVHQYPLSDLEEAGGLSVLYLESRLVGCNRCTTPLGCNTKREEVHPHRVKGPLRSAAEN